MNIKLVSRLKVGIVFGVSKIMIEIVVTIYEAPQFLASKMQALW